MYAETHTEGGVKRETDHNRNKDRKGKKNEGKEKERMKWSGRKGKARFKVSPCCQSSRSAGGVTSFSFFSETLLPVFEFLIGSFELTAQ